MAIALRNVASTVFASDATARPDITVNKPTGTVDGDVMLAAVTCRSSITVTPPSGWTELITQATTTSSNAGSRTTVWRKVASSEGSSYTFDYSSSQADGHLAMIASFSGVDNTTPEDTTPTSVQSDSATDSTINIPSITTVTANAWHVYFAGVNPLSSSGSPVTISNPGDYTEDFDSANQSGTNTLRCALSVGHKTIASPGATSAFDVTTSDTGRNTGISVALRPAAEEEPPGDGAIYTFLTEGVDGNGGATSVTDSVDPADDALLLLCVSNGLVSGTAVDPVSISGLGLTWVKVDNRSHSNGNAALSVWRAMGAPTAGTITINQDATTPESCIWKLVQFSGVDTSGTNGSGAIAQSVTSGSTSTSFSATLTSPNTANAAFLVLTNNSSTSGFTPGSGFTEAGSSSTTNDGSPSIYMFAEYDLSCPSDGVCDGTKVSTGTYVAIAVEVVYSSVVGKTGSDTLNLDENETQVSSSSIAVGGFPSYDEGYGGSGYNALAVTETSALVITTTKTGADTLNLDENETSAAVISTTKTGADTLNLDENETSTTLAIFSGANTVGLDENETSTLVVTLGGADAALGLDVDEAGSVVGSVTAKTSADTLNLDENETSATAILTLKTGADTLGLDENETTATVILTLQTGADTLGLDENETGAVGQVGKSSADSLGLDENETSATQRGFTGTDTLGLDENESGSTEALIVTKTGADTLNLDAQEATGVATTTGTYPANTTFPGGDLYPFPGAELKSATDTLGFDVNESGVVTSGAALSQEFWGVLQI